MTATEESCTALNATCSVSNAPTCTGESVCAYCPQGSSTCINVPGVSSVEECSSLVACELKDGSIEYITEAQCLNSTGVCTSDCVGQSCRALNGQSGVCVLGGAMSSSICTANGGLWYQNATCLLTSIQNQYSCSLASSLNNPTSWQSCGTLDPASCVPSNFSYAQQYLSCFVDQFRDCLTPDECKASGNCTDRSYVRRVVSSNVSTGVIVEYGLCVLSGYYDSTLPNKVPFCNGVQRMANSYAGCAYPSANMSTCLETTFIQVETFQEKVWSVFLTPATTKEECLANSYGRYGCRLPTGERFWFWNESDCYCWGGSPDYLWR